MSICLIVEDNDQIYLDLQKLLAGLEKDFEYQRFHSLKEFSLWTKNLIELKNKKIEQEEQNKEVDATSNQPENQENQKPPTEALPDEFEIEMLITNVDLLGPKHVSLYKKLNQFYRTYGFLGEKERLPVFFTARQTQELKLSDFMLSFFDCIFFYPFDFKVCLSKMQWSFDGAEALDKEELHAEKPLHAIEMLKDVLLESYSQTGFETISSIEIPRGKLARYYCKEWTSGKRQGVFARCMSSVEHPLLDDQYRSTFSYFGLSNQHISSIKEVMSQSSELSHERVGGVNHENKQIFFTIVHPEKEIYQKLKAFLSDQFSNIQLTWFTSFSEFTFSLDPQLFFDEDNLEPQLTLTFNKDSHHLLCKDRDLDGLWNGLGPKDLEKLRLVCLQTVPENQRKSIQSIWMGEQKSPVNVALKVRGETIPLEITGSRTLTKEESKEKIGEDAGEKIPDLVELKIRRLLPQEVLSLKLSEQSLPERLDGVFFNLADLKKYNRLDLLCMKKKLESQQSGQACYFFSIGEEALQFYQDVDRLEVFEDHFVEPLNREYILFKLAILVEELESKSVPSQLSVSTSQTIQSSVPVNVERISEVSATVTYYRSIKSKKFRKFLIWSAKNKASREVLARVVESETNPKDKSEKLNHFVFFGQTGQARLFVRKWLNEQYVITKELEAEQEQEG